MTKIDNGSLAREPATADVERVAAAMFEADPDVGTTWVEWVAYADAHPHFQQDVEFTRRQARAVALLFPSSEPAIAEGERERVALDCAQIAEAFANGSKQMAEEKGSDEGLVAGEETGRFISNAIRRRYGLLLAQSSTPPASKGVEAREGCIGTMDPARATYFLERFKREEKWLGPHEQWALDYTIAALAASPTPSNDTLQGRGEVERLREYYEAAQDLLSAWPHTSLAQWERHNEARDAIEDTRHDG